MKVLSTFVGLVGAALVALPSFGATTYYVSKTGSGGDGKSWETAKTTIQAAVDLCAAGDTVIVDDGEYSDTTDVTISSTPVPTVVKISKQITLKSRNGKEKTHIVGAHANTANGLGVGAHRGIYNTASGTLIQGFTIRDCATVGTENAVNNRFSNGGAISCGSGNCTVVDCTIDNCCAGQGGACDNRVDFFRCLITRCRAVGVIQVFYRGSYAANCIIANCGNGSGEIMPNVQPMTVANCTFIANNCAISAPNKDQTDYLYNCAVLGNLRSVSSSAYTIPEYCVDSRTDGRIATVGEAGHCQGGVDELQYLSPASGDWRLMQGGVLKDAGNDAYADLSWIPEAYRTDFRGKPRKVGTVDIGAIELQADESPAVACTGRLVLNDANLKFSVDGQDLVYSPGRFWHAFDRWPGQLRVKPTFSGDVFGYTVSNDGANTYTTSRFPDNGTDGGFWLTPTPDGVTSVTAIPATDVKWVDDDADETVADGSETKPFKTIPQAMATVPDNGIIRVKPGVYATGTDTGSAHDAGSDEGVCRVSLWKHVAVRSTDGAEKTVLMGGSDVTTIVRPSRRTRNAQVQGFTLTGGATDPAQDETQGETGGAFYAQPSSGETSRDWSETIHLTDCIISNNVSSTRVVTGGWLERCYLCDNFTTKANMDKGTGGNRGTQAYGSILTGCVITYSPQYFQKDGYPTVCTSACQNDTLINCTLNIPSLDAKGLTYRTFNTPNGCTVAYNNATVGGAFDSLISPCIAAGIVSSPGSTVSPWKTAFDTGTFFNDADNADYRPIAGSAGTAAGAAVAPQFVRYETGDFNGQALAYQENGATIPGAYQVPVKLLVVSCTAQGTVKPSGILTVGDGESITFTATVNDAAHSLVGWLVDGERVETTSLTYVYTVDYAKPAFSISPIFTTDLYVDASKTDDSGDGASPATAKKTLAAIAALAVEGDTIHAAAGDYNERFDGRGPDDQHQPGEQVGLFALARCAPEGRCARLRRGPDDDVHHRQRRHQRQPSWPAGDSRRHRV